MDKWKPDRSGKYLTIVYRDVGIGDEVLEITKHEKSCAMSWSHALWDVDYLRNCIKPQQRTWVGLTDEEIATTADYFKDAYGFTQGVLWAEAKLREKNSL